MLGFVGMLRPHVFKQLQPGSFRLVSGSGAVVPLPTTRRGAQRMLYQLKSHNDILGFYIRFESKTMRDAKAYFPTLCKTSPSFAPMCPTSALLEIVEKGWMSGSAFKLVTASKQLVEFLKDICGAHVNIAPYALRIGGRTWLLTQGMDRQLVDFLGTWKSPEASARYYRANPDEVLRLLQRFYAKVGGRGDCGPAMGVRPSR